MLVRKGREFEVQRRGPHISVCLGPCATAGSLLRLVESDTGRHLQAESIDVEPGLQRQKIGSTLYEIAGEFACSRGLQLVSDSQRSHFSEAVWRKQKRLGRARCVAPNTNKSWNVFDGPSEKLRTALWEDCLEIHNDAVLTQKCVDSKVRSILKALPKPRHGTERFFRSGPTPYWPCWRWGLKKRLCKQLPLDLSGW
jgi:hypothetical protein